MLILCFKWWTAVLNKPPLTDLSSISPCTHEEADIRMLWHVAHAAQNCQQKIMILTVDTDVVDLAVAAAQDLKAGDELWLAFGTGKSLWYQAALETSAAIGPEKAHASIKLCWACEKDCMAGWVVFPELTNAVLELSSAPHDILQEVMATISQLMATYNPALWSNQHIHRHRPS